MLVWGGGGSAGGVRAGDTFLGAVAGDAPWIGSANADGDWAIPEARAAVITASTLAACVALCRRCGPRARAGGAGCRRLAL
ncbi:hypothetical protein ACFSUH_44325, partial [Rhodococcus jostii]|uniref:hypothetical protein n=1 Tax=Rhodococcus jostii TaxID=132919 RepID=UPI003632CB72